MFTIKNIRASLTLALAVIVTGCQDTSGPGSLNKLNAAAALADYSAMDGVLQSTGWKSFQMAAAKMNVMVAPTPIANAAGGAGSVPLISEEHRGRTFVFDAQRHDWVVDPARTGAPANGVRFITYEPKGAEPDPTRPIGHADLIDLGDAGAAIALRLVVVEGSMTILDYKTTVEGSNGTGHVTVEGFLQNSRDRLDFEIDVRGQNSGGIERGDISLDLGIAAREFRVTGDVHHEKQNGAESGRVDLDVRHGANSFGVDIANARGSLSGDVDLNDSAFATVSGTSAQPVFKKPSGADITGGEALVLLRIFDITEDVFDLFEDLVEPIGELVILAVILQA